MAPVPFLSICDERCHTGAMTKIRAVTVLSIVLFAFVVSGCGSTTTASEQDGLIFTPRDDGEDVSGDTGADGTGGTGADATGSTESAAGQSSIADVEFTWWDGTPATGSELIGTPTVINFFASSCAPCVKELPDFEAVSHRFDGQVRFVGIAAGDDRQAAQQLLDETGVTFETGEDPDNEMFIAMGSFVLPTTYLVDENGTVVANQIGAMNAEMLTDAITTNFPGVTES